MGFTTGFTGGVTVTLGAIYLTVLAHQRNRETQSALLRAQTQVLNSLIDPRPLPPPPSRAETAALARANILETAKDKWNHEIENAVRWVQRTDWDEVREDMEDRVAGLWTRAFGDAIAAADSATKNTESTSFGATEKASVAATSAAHAAKQKSSQVAGRVGERAADAKNSLVSAVERGLEKGRDFVDKAMTGTTGAGGKFASRTESDVEKALRQRYEEPKPMNQSVDEILKDRYTPANQRDQTVLRGL